MLDSGGDVFYNRAKFCIDNRQECMTSDISGWDVLTDYLHVLEFGFVNVTRVLSGIHIRQMEYLECAYPTVTVEEGTAVFNDLL